MCVFEIAEYKIGSLFFAVLHFILLFASAFECVLCARCVCVREWASAAYIRSRFLFYAQVFEW